MNYPTPTGEKGRQWIRLLGRSFSGRSWKDRLGRVALFGLVPYAGILLVLLVQEDRFVFGPRSPVLREPPAEVRPDNVKMRSRTGESIHAWWATPAEWQPDQGAVLFCHGNTFNLSDRGPALPIWLHEMKQAILLFDYPGFGRSSGEPSEAGCYIAGEAAYDWLRQVQQVPAERIILYGGSLGSGVATDLASRRPHRALVLVAPFTSIPDMAQTRYPWLPARWLVRNQFDNLSRIAQCRGPVFIAHGTADGLIPIRQSERLFAAAGEPKRFVPLQGFGHTDLPPAEFYPALRDFLAECEKRATPSGAPAKGAY
jgi:fermentation-respiration switch protein FrsA (DUF1100 family)